MAFAYITKSIAGFIVLAFILAVGYDFFCESKDRVHKFVYALLSGISFFIVYVVWISIQKKLFLITKDGGGVDIFRNLANINQVCYFVYAIMLSFMTTIIAMGYFPVVLPFFSLEKFSKSNRVYAIFSGALLLVNTIGVAYLIIINETPLALEFNHHYRYCEHLGIDFIIIFIVCIQHIRNDEFNERQRFWLIIINIIVACIFLFMFWFSTNGIQLECYRFGVLSKFDLSKTASLGEFYIQPSLLFFKIFAIAFGCVILFLYLKRHWRIFGDSLLFY